MGKRKIALRCRDFENCMVKLVVQSSSRNTEGAVKGGKRGR
jgi:hypothetical protein